MHKEHPRQPQDELRPELLELRRDIVRRSPIAGIKVPRDKDGNVAPVSRRDVLERLGGIQDLLCGRQWSVQELAERFEIPLEGPNFQVEKFDPHRIRRYDVPKSIQLTPLYSKPAPQPPQTHREAYTICLGLLRSPQDPHVDLVQPAWRYPDPPEIEVSNDTRQTLGRHDISGWAKYHVTFTGAGEPVLNISPIQMAIPQSRTVLEEDEGRLSGWQERMFGIEGGSPFKYSDRRIALALVGLEVAELLGVSKVGIPMGYKKVTEEEMHTNTQRMMHDDTMRGMVAWHRYIELGVALRRGHSGFDIGGINLG